MTMRSLQDRITDADVRASTWLADANEARERGKTELADRLYQKVQFWKDRYNLLTNQAEFSGPSA